MKALCSRAAILIGICVTTSPLASWPFNCLPCDDGLSGTCRAAESFPYQAQVTSEVAEVMSGPGESFYATDRLARGTAVEVHRHERGGWCAIRPPAGSFSWVPVEMLEVLPDGIHARVIRDDAFTYVGSKYSTAHHVEYIPLEPGEQVRLLGSQVLADPQTGQPREWVQVAPPDGEFRWIQRQHLGRAGSSDRRALEAGADRSALVQPASWDTPTGDSGPAGKHDGGAAPARFTTDRQPTQNGDSTADSESGSPLTAPPRPLPATTAPDLSTAPSAAGSSRANNSTRPSRIQPMEGTTSAPVDRTSSTDDETQPSTGAGEESSEAMWRPRGSSDRVQMAVSPSHADDATPSSGDDPESDSNTSPLADTVDAGPLEPLTDATELADQIRALDLELTAMVAQPVESWHLATLRDAASRLAEQTRGDPRAEDYLRNLDRRMAQFERVHQRYQQLALSARSSGSAHVNGRPAAAAPRLIGAAGRASEGGRPRRVPTGTAARDPGIVPATALTGAGQSSVATDAQDSPFDGEGILMPVFTSRTDVPEFALTDGHGRIVQFVSAGDGINLREFARLRVGVYGTLGFLPALQQQHLTATRIVVLSDDGR